jgi:hypothetical protein
MSKSADRGGPVERRIVCRSMDYLWQSKHGLSKLADLQGFWGGICQPAPRIRQGGGGHMDWKLRGPPCI